MSFKLLKIGMDALRRARIGRARVLTRRIGRAALVAAALCVATAPSPSWADKTISANTILTEDTDWSDQGTVTIAEGATLDLAGHVLQVSALAGTGSIVDSSQYRILEYIEATGAQKITTDYVPGSAT